jgi:DNA end-binding protein Ku
MARAVWSGSISFGLVNIPVKAYTAVRDHDVHFHRLDKKTGSRVRNRKVSDTTGKEVDDADVEMGFEVAKGRYVTFTKKDLDELKPASTQAIDVSDFVSLYDIDPIYYERTYWLGPDGDTAKKAYSLLLSAMADRERVGIGAVVMRNKQYLAAVRPLDGALAMSTMRFADEIVPRSTIDGLTNRAAKPDAKALRMAADLIDGLSADWNPERYHDTYTEELRKRIKAKQAGKTIEEPEAPPTGAKVVDLMAALQASVEAAKGRRKPARRRSSRPAARKSA